MKYFWDERFAQEVFAYGQAPNAYFKKIVDTLAPGRMLVPGAGEGRDAVYAALRGWEVHCLDQSTEGCKKALALAGKAGVHIAYEVCDVADFMAPGLFDAIGCVFFHLPPLVRQSFHRKVVSWLAPGGHLIIQGFTPEQLAFQSGGPRERSWLFTPDMLAGELNGLQIAENTAYGTVLDEGPFHQGEAAVLGFHGVKPALLFT